MKISTLFSKQRADELLHGVRTGRELSVREQIVLVVLLSVPAVMAQMSHIAMEYIDAAMVGSLGANASASVGLMSTSAWLVWGLCSSVAAGFNVLVAHRVGGRDFAAARSVCRQGLVFCLFFSLCVAAAGFGISNRLPLWLGGGGEICADAAVYFGLICLALPVVQVNMLCNGALRSSGNVVVPSLLGVLMCALDVLFNFLFIFPTRSVDVCGLAITIPGAGLGVKGAAIGTVVAQALVAGLLLWYLCCRSGSIRLSQDDNRLRMFVPRLDCLRRALSVSLPMALQHLAMTGAQVASTTIVAPLGKMSIAANSFGVTAESLCYMPGYGIADAAQTLVGQSIGAGRHDLTRNFARVSLTIGMTVMTLMGAVMYFAAPLMMGILSPVAEIQNLGVEALRIEAFAEPMFAASIVCYGIFVGAGDTLKPCFMNLFSMWAVRLTLAWWLAPHWGLNGVWTAMCIELCFRGIIFLLRLRFGNWERRKSKL